MSFFFLSNVIFKNYELTFIYRSNSTSKLYVRARMCNRDLDNEKFVLIINRSVI